MPEIPHPLEFSKLYTSLEDAIPQVGAITEVGARGSGKSVFFWELADRAHRQGREVVVYGIPRAAHHLFPSYVTHVSGDFQQLRRHRGALVGVDEAAIRAPARRHMSDANMVQTELIAIARQADQLLVWISQHTRQIDINIVGDVDRIVFKRPSILHVRFARPELKGDVLMARQAIMSKGRDFQKWSYILDYNEGGYGLVPNRVPTWWTDEASKAFSLAQAGELVAPQGRRAA